MQYIEKKRNPELRQPLEPQIRYNQYFDQQKKPAHKRLINKVVIVSRFLIGKI